MLMAVCNLLNTYSPADIGRALMTYSRDENADKFIDRFINNREYLKQLDINQIHQILKMLFRNLFKDLINLWMMQQQR